MAVVDAGKSVPSEERFKQSIAGLSQSLGARAARHPDPVGEATARRAAVQALFRARARRLKWLAGGAAAATGAVAVAAALIFFAASPPAVPAASAVQVVAAAVVPTPALSPPSPPPSPPSRGVTELPVPPAPPVSAPAPAPQEAAVRRDEMREIQTRLLAFGFNPGPIDGDFGSRTQGAVMRYQQERGRVQTGAADRDLLQQLRRDPAPKVVVAQQAAARQAAPPEPPRATAQRRSRPDPFDFLRTADGNLSRWFQSLSR